jgi:hypothetical protein
MVADQGSYARGRSVTCGLRFLTIVADVGHDQPLTVAQLPPCGNPVQMFAAALRDWTAPGPL